MRVPLEILEQILRDMMEALPIKDLFRARLVNSLFNDEIMSFLSRSSRLETDGFGCYKDKDGDLRHWDPSDNDNKKDVPGWDAFPYHLKIRILRQKLQRHNQEGHRTYCVGFCDTFTSMLGNQVQKRGITTTEEKEALVERLLNGVAACSLRPHGIICPESLRLYMRCGYERLVWGSKGRRSRQFIDQSCEVLLACGAIHSGDAGELEYLIRKGLGQAMYSSQWGLMVLELGVRTGNTDINQVLKRNSPMTFTYNGLSTDVLSLAAQYNNFEALEVWIEHMKYRSSSTIRLRMDATIRGMARTGKTDMVEFLVDEYGNFEQDLVYNALIEAIETGHQETVQRLLGREGFDPNITTAEFPKGALFSAVCKCKPIKRRLLMVKMLLKQGVDPRKPYPGMTKTLLQRALEKEDSKTAAVLVEYGADITSKSLPRGSKGKKLPPVLFMAAELGDMTLIHLLVEKGVDRTFKWEGKGYTLRQEDQSIGSPLGTLGFYETDRKNSTFR
ncbi:ankyrin [Aspergillus affinis]|uniref:ankyrin n=1 Tax=Aspergillus affinis TaxID=1070780 RepID=UPI0022FE5868|nr:ankyrin [Aspergillus affinis]KAI9046262.1 ankyrin [Aspergillus affinis]